jgi:hypothetical protein
VEYAVEACPDLVIGIDNDIIASLGLGPEEDAFLLNTKGVLQTSSKFYGQVLDDSPIQLRSKAFQPTIMETTDPQGRDVLLSYVHFPKLEFVRVFVKLRSKIFHCGPGLENAWAKRYRGSQAHQIGLS